MNIIECGGKTDLELVQQTLEQQDYFLCIMQKYEAPLLRYITRLSNCSKEEAEDMLQEGFIKAYYNLNEFNQNQKFSSWLYRIIHNQVISTWRKNKARPHGNSIQVEDHVIHSITAEFEIEDDIDQKYLREYLEEILSEIDIKYKDVLVLKFFEEKSYEEISDILKKPKSTVGTLLNRAKKQCKKIIEQRRLEE